MYIKNLTLFLMILMCTAVFAQPSYNYPSISCTVSTQSDPLSSRTVTQFSNYSDIVLPTSARNVWIDGNFVVFESDMTRPSGTPSGSDEKQLMALDIALQRFLWLGPIEQENSFIYGGGHFNIPADSHFACSKNGMIVYRDITGHRLYLKRFDDNATIELLRIFAGTFIGAPSISDDGSKVLIEAVHSGPDTYYYSGKSRSMIVFDIDTQNMALVSSAQVPFTFADRKANNTQGAEVLGDAVLNAEGSWVAFKTALTSLSGETSSRICFLDSDGSDYRRLVDNVSDCSDIVTLGDNIYFVAEGGFARANVLSSGYQKWRRLSDNQKVKYKAKPQGTKRVSIPLALNRVGMEKLTVDSDGDIIYNTSSDSYDSNGLAPIAIYSLDVDDAEKTTIASARQGEDSSRKSNFHLSPDESKLVFVDYDISASRISLVDMP